jgi:non-specific serine/threonine protein kinase
MAERVVQTPASWRLPSQPNELIGREASIVASRNALLRADCRLLTLVGPGGIGKTRLAIAVADTLSEALADGVCFVDLTEVTEAASVPSLLAAKLQLQVEEQALLQHVKEYLRERQLLLVLDNFEHVLPAVVLVIELIEGCPRLKVLATSREPLRPRWEWRMPVRPLELPDLDSLRPEEELKVIPAIALFLQRARAVNMSFEARGAKLREVAALCVWLDGVPLAIELAAARTNVLSPSDILRRLDERISVLQQNILDVPARHGSIEAALDWSYRLLSDREQAVLRRLGVFVGRFTLEAATAVVAEERETGGVLELLSSLADKGLIIFEPTPEGEPQCRLLETVRTYALEQLTKSGEKDVVERRHAHYYLSVAEEDYARLRFGGYFVFSPPEERDSSGPEPPPWPAALDRDYANLRASLAWAQNHDPPMLIRLAFTLARYWWVRGYLPDGIPWLQSALEQNPDADPERRSRALGGLAILYRQQAEFERALPLLEEALSLARRVSDARLLFAQLINLNGVLASLHRLEEATTLIEEAAALTAAIGDAWGLAVAQTYLGWRSILDQDGEEAEMHLATSLETFRGLGDLRSTIVVAMTLARAIGLQGDVQRALSLVEDTFPLCRELGQDSVTALALEITAALLSGKVSSEASVRLLGAGDSLRERGYRRVILERAIYDPSLALSSAKLGAEAMAAALAQGRQLSGEQAIDEALALIQQALSASAEALLGTENGDLLSEREREVLVLLASGYSNREIGDRLCISENTAKYHVGSILNKLGVSNRAEAVNVAVNRGLVQ